MRINKISFPQIVNVTPIFITDSPVTVTAEVAVKKASKKDKSFSGICAKGIISNKAPITIKPKKESIIIV